jgi:hypothetical protein
MLNDQFLVALKTRQAQVNQTLQIVGRALGSSVQGVTLHEVGNGNGGDPFAEVDKTMNIMLANEPLHLVIMHSAADQSELAQETRLAQVRNPGTLRVLGALSKLTLKAA